jgi:hypothetical protein
MALLPVIKGQVGGEVAQPKKDEKKFFHAAPFFKIKNISGFFNLKKEKRRKFLPFLPGMIIFLYILNCNNVNPLKKGLE